MVPDQRAKQLVILGCNHQLTPLDVRERVALASENIAPLLQRLRDDPDITEALVLNTCNRVEIHAVTNIQHWQSRLATHLESANRFPVDAFLPIAYGHTGEAAALHAFTTAAGLDSQIVGETQILGQMKEAYAAANASGCLGPVLHRLFQKAFQAAKWAHSSTGISSGQTSLGNVAVELASRIFGKLTVSRTLIVGSGDVGKEVAKAFRSRGVACMSIASRTPERALDLAKSVDGLVIPFKTWQDHLPFIDIAIFATSAPSLLLDKDAIAAAMEKRHHRPLFLIDLAMPRDIDPQAADLPHLYLYNLEDLSAIANENLRQRQQAVDSCLQVLRNRSQSAWQAVQRRL
jgi:glutamyl-tRNA reductase